MTRVEISDPASDSKRVFGLDVLRTLAVLSVFLYHYQLPSHSLVVRLFNDHGWAGVDLFFVLSGFLIGGQLFGALAKGPEPSIPRFYFRRFMRTLPNYFFVLLVFYYLWPETPELRAEPLWRFMSFTQNIGRLHTFAPSWSLCVEEHFYLVFPVLAVSVFRSTPRDQLWGRLRNLTMAVCAGGILLRAALWLSFRPDLIAKTSFGEGYLTYCSWIYYFTPTRLDGIAIGVLLAALSVFRRDAWERALSKPRLWAATGVGFLGLGVVCDHWRLWADSDPGRMGFSGSVLSFVLLALGFACLVFPACRTRNAPHPWIGRFFNHTAQLSYAMYLLNLPALFFVNELLKSVGIVSPGYLPMLVHLVGLYLMSEALHQIVEKPALLLRDRVEITALRKKSPAL